MSAILLVLRRHWVLILAVLVLLLCVTAIEYGVLQFTHGEIAYAQDDTYIHLAIARNLADHGVWGITAYEFASASSSILYTLLLAGVFKIWPQYLLVPLIVNLVSAIAFLWVTYRWLNRRSVNKGTQVFILMLLIFLIPLPVLVVLGMEHTLQCLFTFLFVYGFSEWFGRVKVEREKEISLPMSLYFWGLLTATVRYEGVFLVLIACLILAWNRRWLFAINLGAFSLLPILIFGVYSVTRGGFFIPNSVLLKSGPSLLTPGGMLRFLTHDVYEKLTSNFGGMNSISLQRLLFLLPLTGILFANQLKENSAYRFIIMILTGGVFLHLAFAATIPTFCRYEAYLVGCAIPIVSCLVIDWTKDRHVADSALIKGLLVFLSFILLFPFLIRSTEAFQRISLCCINIYQQQFQAGRFLRQYYNNATVSFNDIGAISYQTSGKKLDLVGLGSQEVAKSIKGGYRTAPFIDSISKVEGVQIAVVHENWFPPTTFRPWKRVAALYVPNNITLASSYLSFFAVDTSLAPSLKRDLRTFQPTLPPGVVLVYNN